jgi:hypothetical protein
VALGRRGASAWRELEQLVEARSYDATNTQRTAIAALELRYRQRARAEDHIPLPPCS